MSNNFASYYTLSPSIQQGNNYVSAQVFGPLNTSQTPGTIKYHSYGSLPGVHPNPPKFYPSDNSSSFSQSRYQYAKCDTTVKQQIIAREKVLADFKSFISLNAFSYFSRSFSYAVFAKYFRVFFLFLSTSGLRTSYNAHAKLPSNLLL